MATSSALLVYGAAVSHRRYALGAVPGRVSLVCDTLDNFTMAGLTFALGYIEGFAPFALMALAVMAITRL